MKAGGRVKSAEKRNLSLEVLVESKGKRDMSRETVN